MKNVHKKTAQPKFGQMLMIEQLVGLTAELQKVRTHPPLVMRSEGKYEGGILGFVKGLRLSARVIYFLRERLSSTDLKVDWGHLVDSSDESLSPECDVIIHEKGHLRKWNGSEESIMDFRFVQAGSVRAIISCKSSLASIDKSYPKTLKKFGVKTVFLFAECCAEDAFSRLRKEAKAAGYRDLCCLYFTQKNNGTFKTDEKMYVAFGRAVVSAVTK